MRKIVIITQYFPPEMGAPQSRLYETALGLQKRGWQVTVVAAMPNYPTGKVFDDYKGKFSCKENKDGIDIYRYTLYASNSKKSLPRIISMLSYSIIALFSAGKLRRIKPDYVLTESPPLTLALSGLYLAKWCGARHIMNVSDLWPLSAYKLGAISKGFIYNRLEWLEKYLYRKSYACTGQSQEIVSQLEASGAKRTLLYRNGVDIQRFDEVRKDVKQIPAQHLRIVYAGLLGVAQGILDVCKQINFEELGAELHIYGEGAERNEIIDYLAANKDKGIYLHDSVKRNDVPATIMQYDVTLVPLIKPIFGAVPSKIYEAMAAGLPIIFTGGGEGAVLIEQHKAGWVCETADYTAIKNRIAAIATMNQEELLTIKNNCINAARNIFNREMQIDNLHLFLSNSN